MKEIAVHMSQDGKATEVTEPGQVVVYRFEEQAWSPARAIPLLVNLELGRAAIRLKVAEVRLFLGRCNIFLSGNLPPVVARALENKGIHVWEYETDPHAEAEARAIEERENISPAQAWEKYLPVAQANKAAHTA